jgi:hypothetical protein
MISWKIESNRRQGKKSKSMSAVSRVTSQHEISVVPRASLLRCTLILLSSFVLSILLLFAPYFQYNALGAQVYANTHSTGLDPRDWFPYSWEGFGLLLYNLWPWVLLFTISGVLPLVIAQIYRIHRHWHYITAKERWFYSSSTTAAMGQFLLLLVVGQGMIPWLID